jgi:hypothetical protein
VTDASLQGIIHIPSLEVLSVEETGVTERGANLPRKALTGCGVFGTKGPGQMAADAGRNPVAPQR